MLSTATWEVVKTATIVLGGLLLLKFSSTLFARIRKRTRKTATIWDDILFEFLKRVTQFFTVTCVFYYIAHMVDRESIATLLRVFLIFLGGYLSVKVLTYVLNQVQKTLVKESETRLDDLVFPMLKKIVAVSVYAVALIISLDYLGYDITALLAGMGIAGIAVSLAAKDSLSNIIAGALLLLDKPFLPGDRVELWNSPPNQATWGDVVEIGLRSTKIRTTDNIIIIIPNSQLMKRDIINYTAGSPSIRLRIPVDVSYESNLSAVKKVLIGSISDVKGILSDPEPRVVVKEFGDSSILVELRVWIENAKERRIIQDEINRRIKVECEKSAIEMPHPAQDVYIKEHPGHTTDSDTL